jgi:hypothetical protein
VRMRSAQSITRAKGKDELNRRWDCGNRATALLTPLR